LPPSATRVLLAAWPTQPTWKSCAPESGSGMPGDGPMLGLRGEFCRISATPPWKGSTCDATTFPGPICGMRSCKRPTYAGPICPMPICGAWISPGRTSRRPRSASPS
jgi:hypothetical protein